MTPAHYTHLRSSLAGKCILFLALLSYCATVFPIPAPNVQLAASDEEAAFPCKHCGCGCKTAHQCWTSCCCYTPSQRLKWAKQNNVTPPSYAVLPSILDEVAEGSSCSHCAKKVSKAREQKASTLIARKTSKLRFSYSMMALKCQGKSSAFSQAMWAIPIERPIVSLESDLPEEFFQRAQPSLSKIYIQPETPPPRFLLS